MIIPFSTCLLLVGVTLGVAPPAPSTPPAATDKNAAAEEAGHLSNIRQLTFGFSRAGEGYFSPDGKTIIYQAVPPGQNDYQIYTQALTPDAKPKLVSTGKGKCTCSFFHPDGKSILFGSSHLDPALADQTQGADAAGPKAKTPAYSRTERYRWDFDPYMDIFAADLDGKIIKRLTDSPGYDAEGSYSPDGKSILFTSFRDGDAEIYIMNADGSKPRRITHSKGYDGGPFFSPDGKRIIYRSDRKGNDLLQIYINNLEGTAERALTSNEAVNWGPFFHPDGKHIVYSTSIHGHDNYEVYLLNVDTGEQDRVTYAKGFDGLPVFSPDGKKMMWTSKGRSADNTSQLFIADFSLTAAPKLLGD